MRHSYAPALAILSLFVPQQHASSQSPYALRGTVVSPSKVTQDGSVSINGTTITSVDGTAAPSAIDVDGVIFPGLVDLHNHLSWNVFPRWKPGRFFGNRYEWQEATDYLHALLGPHAILTDTMPPQVSHGCAMNRYAELKEIVNGATSTVGGDSLECVRGLARNLDWLSELTANQKLGTELLRYLVFPFQPAIPCDEQTIRDIGKTKLHDCSTFLTYPPESTSVARRVPPILRAVVAHVAEGTDASSRREFSMLERHGYLVKGFSLIHGVGLERSQFQEMHKYGVGFVWSPRSNIELYGRTVDIAAVRSESVLTAIAPDWSPSGSTGMLAELAYVERLRSSAPFKAITDSELVAMATVNPATLAGLDDKIGKIESGHVADLIVMRRRPWTRSTPPNSDQAKSLAYQALLMQRPEDLKLVIIGGRPIFGEPALMTKLLPPAALALTETIKVCGQDRLINARAGTFSGTPWSATELELRSALAALRIRLAEFVECY